MSGKIIRQGHECNLPSVLRHTPGTVWQCDCGRYWGVQPGHTWASIGLFDVIALGIADNMAKGQRKREELTDE